MNKTTLKVAALFLSLFAAGSASALDVQLTPELPSVDVMNHGETVTIMRNQDTKNMIRADYAKTSRKCPPFCIRPIVIAEGVETLGELEIIHYVKMASDGDDSILVIDSRTPDWVAKGTIAGSVNIPWTHLDTAKGASPFDIAEIMQEKFGVEEQEGLWNYSKAKTLVLFCNGMWCGQSPRNIKTLLKFGYPASKIKWYRGGMQNLETLGLSTVKPPK